MDFKTWWEKEGSVMQEGGCSAETIVAAAWLVSAEGSFDIYKCSECGREIGRREKGVGISFGNFTLKGMPIGTGSGLYDYWICHDCDKNRVDSYIEENKQALRPWMKIGNKCAI